MGTPTASTSIEPLVADTPTVGQVIERWQSELDVRERTKRGYLRGMASFVAWADAQGLSIANATRADILAYRDYLSERHGPSTVAAYLVPVRSLYRWAAQVTGRPSIVEGIKSPRASREHARDALTREQARDAIEAVEAEAEGGGLSSLRDAALFELLVNCGLRTVEASRADVGDLRTLGGKRVLFVQGKGHDAKDDYVVLPECVGRAIDAYLGARGPLEPTSPLFAGHGNRSRGRLSTRSISAIAKECLRSAGINSPRLTAHSLRHTAVTSALMGGATIQQAQAMARHSRIETTMIYAHNLERLEAPAEYAVADFLRGGEGGSGARA